MKLKLLKTDALILTGSILLIASSLLALLLPLNLRGLIDGNNPGKMTEQIVKVALIFLGQALLASLGTFLFNRSGEEKIARLRLHVAENLLYARKSFFDQQKSGALASRIVNDTTLVREFLVDSFPNFVMSFVMILGSIIVLFRLDWQLSLILLISLPLMLLFVTPLANISERYSGRIQEEMSILTGNLTEKFQEIETIKTCQEEEKIQGLLKENIQTTLNVSTKSDFVTSFENPFALLFIFGTVAFIFTYGGQRVASGDLSVGTLVSFLIYLFQLLNPVSSLSNFFTTYARMKGATNSLEDLLLVEQENLLQGEPAVGQNLVLNNVSFSYEKGQPVLENISLVIPNGKKIAFVGPSGSGKSTLVRLIARFYEPNAGMILLDGQPIQDISLQDWRRRLAWVSQNDAILSGSIRDNLTFGLQKSVSDTELFAVLDQVLMLNEVLQMSQGLETEVGERGRLLSGGQRQRLQIARAYLRGADFFIMDEGTANLDADSEYAVTQNLKSLMRNKTSLIIAHRLSTIKDADCIYFLENRQITGSGTHQQLLESHETYARFVKEQMI